jgi:hypothetical protein
LGGLTNITLQLSINGAYFDVERFLDRLRDGPRLVVIDAVSLSPGDTTVGAGAGAIRGNGTAVTASIVARLFMLGGAVPPGANPPPVTATHAGTGVIEAPINAARTTANAASATAKAIPAATGGTP